MSPSSETNHFHQLADHLDRRQDALLACWRTAVERDRRLAVISKLGRGEFEDNIPASLGVLTQKLREETMPVTEYDPESPNDYWAARSQRTFAQTHGFHRWHEGFDLRQLMLEIGYLNQAIVLEIDGYQTLNSDVPHDVMARARHFAAELLDASYMHSATEFHRLQEREAEQVAHGLKHALGQLEEMQRQQGQILREAVHDLRGNLTVIQGATSLLTTVAGTDVDAEIQQAVFGLLEKGTKSLGEMLTDLLDLARLEAGKEEVHCSEFDVGDLLEELCASNRVAAEEKGLQLLVEGAVGLKVHSDPLMVRRIAQNLLLNAVRYTRQGEVRVNWAGVSKSEWQLNVEDTGPGLAPSVVNRAVLDVNRDGGATDGLPADHSGKRAGGATQWSAGEGVGLAIVRRLCALLDAQIEVRTVTGQGTNFRVTFSS